MLKFMNKFRYTDTTTNFYEIYKHYIQPKIQNLDLLLKTTSPPFDVDEVIEVLDISKEEFLSIQAELEIKEIDKKTFFKILNNSTSYIGNLVTRQFQLGTSGVYTPESIAHIYALDPPSVQKAFNTLGYMRATDRNLHIVFKHILVPKYTFLYQ
ncbi:hypothetical protein [Candidatus Epulonipiscium viviparus]|uniref:hypothetical protein n=1 Tax=Candidatus Epulonipiscium viviparus TaxID=420336 RepID=UPI00016C0A42|nr:hypothetical protein [Candidatus Epulopiscium viviparus]